MGCTSQQNDWIRRTPPKEKGTVCGREGQAIRYWLYGDSGPVMVLCNGLWSGVELWSPLVSHFRRTRRLLLWEYQGQGFSTVAAAPGKPGVRAFAADAESLLKGIGIERAVFVGHGTGVPIVLEVYRHCPEKVQAIIGLCGVERGPLSRVAPFSTGDLVSRFLARVALPLGVPVWKVFRAFWHAYVPLREEEEEKRKVGTALSKGRAMAWQERIFRIDPRTGLLVFFSMLFYRPSRFLAQMSVPVLILGGDQDLLVPARRYRGMADRIRGASLVLLSGCSHRMLDEDPDGVVRNIETFLQKLGQ